MPRTARADEAGLIYHALNRGNGRAAVFHDADDYDSFVELIDKACRRRPIDVLAYCLMPNPFHLALQPRRDGDIGRWMQWLLTSHVRRYRMCDATACATLPTPVRRQRSRLAGTLQSVSHAKRPPPRLDAALR